MTSLGYEPTVLINHLDSRTISFNMIFVLKSVDPGLLHWTGLDLRWTVLARLTVLC